MCSVTATVLEFAAFLHVFTGSLSVPSQTQGLVGGLLPDQSFCYLSVELPAVPLWSFFPLGQLCSGEHVSALSCFHVCIRALVWDCGSRPRRRPWVIPTPWPRNGMAVGEGEDWRGPVGHPSEFWSQASVAQSVTPGEHGSCLWLGSCFS